LDEALPDLVAVEGVVHEECWLRVPRRRRRRRCCRYLNFLGLVRLVRCYSRPLLGEGPRVQLLVGRVRGSNAPILNLTSLIISRLTRKAVGCIVAVRFVADSRLKKCRRKSRGRGIVDVTMKLLLLPD
jgi:hypothetical protein